MRFKADIGESNIATSASAGILEDPDDFEAALLGIALDCGDCPTFWN
jgi:hypothetical protein